MNDNTIVKKTVLAENVTRFDVYAPHIAAKHRAGEFVIVRCCENGERIPLTIADSHSDAGTITMISQTVGCTTRQLATVPQGEALLDIAGPLGTPTHIENFGTVVCVGGGIGVAPLHPITKAMHHAGNRIISVLGARSKDLFILKHDMAALSDELILTTDDGSEGRQGFVTDALQELIDNGESIDLVVTIGPAIMMENIAGVTRPHAIPTVASLNTIMIDGTGMCGGCRVKLHDGMKFACVDGPEFDGHQVDFKELSQRQNAYKEDYCRLDRKVEELEAEEA